MSSVEKRLFAKRNHQMEELMDWTRPLSLKEQEQVLAEAREKNWRDRMAREDYVFEQGLEEGIEKGAQAEKQAVVLNMLKGGFDTPVIAKITGFSEEEINKLKNSS